MSKAPKIQNPLKSHVGYWLRRLSALTMQDLAQVLNQLELRPAEASALILIDANPNITQSKLGQELGIQRANMAPIVARMLERGLLEREGLDGKSIGLRLSPAGAQLCKAVKVSMADHNDRYFGGFSPAQRDRLVQELAAALEAAEHSRAPGEKVLAEAG